MLLWNIQNFLGERIFQEKIFCGRKVFKGKFPRNFLQWAESFWHDSKNGQKVNTKWVFSTESNTRNFFSGGDFPWRNFPWVKIFQREISTEIFTRSREFLAWFEKRSESKYKLSFFNWKQGATLKLKTNKNYSIYMGGRLFPCAFMLKFCLFVIIH